MASIVLYLSLSLFIRESLASLQVLQHIYKDLVADVSAADTTPQAEIDEYLNGFFELEEPDLGIYSAAVSTFKERYKSSGAPCCMDFWLSKTICSEVAKVCHFCLR